MENIKMPIFKIDQEKKPLNPIVTITTELYKDGSVEIMATLDGESAPLFLIYPNGTWRTRSGGLAYTSLLLEMGFQLDSNRQLQAINVDGKKIDVPSM